MTKDCRVEPGTNESSAIKNDATRSRCVKTSYHVVRFRRSLLSAWGSHSLMPACYEVQSVGSVLASWTITVDVSSFDIGGRGCRGCRGRRELSWVSLLYFPSDGAGSAPGIG